MIDVLLPYYGTPALAQQTVRSVLDQDSPDWRLVVVDDAYPDPAFGRWVQDLRHDQVTYLRNETNLGVSGNFRRCVELATADHLVIVGGDDILLPHYVRTVEGCLRHHPDVALVQPGVRVIDQHGDATRPLPDRVKRWLTPRGTGERIVSGESLVTSLLLGDWMYFPAITWRRDLLQLHPFRQDLHTTLDLALLLDLAFEGHDFLVCDVEAFGYRRHSSSASSVEARSTARFAEERAIYAAAELRCRTLGWRRAARAARAHPTSRAHAALHLPHALASGDRSALRAFLHHTFGRTGR